jgi:AraC family transcriptional regulator
MKRYGASQDRVYVLPSQFTIRHGDAARVRLDLDAGPEFVFVFVLGGTLQWRAEDGAGGEAAAGAVIFNAAGHSLHISGAGPVEYVALTVSPAVLLDCAVRARLARGDVEIGFPSRAAAAGARLTRVARDLADELRGAEAGAELLIASLVEQALVHVLRGHANLQRAAGLELSRAGLVDRRIRRAVELMHAHLERELPLEELSRAAHLSPFHFARLFKKLTGATPHSYLARLRAARAQSLLAETDLSITEVAARVGYASSSHFSKAFRQATGLSPRAFRNALVRP